MSQYSPFFEVIHDEQKPVGFIGRGTHYSIFQYPSWVTESGSSLGNPIRHRFAVIWDEDHDIRVIPVLEGLYLARALTSTMFIGERKGSISAILSNKDTQPRKQELQSVFESIATSLEDPWTVDLFSWEETGGIINDDIEKVKTYLSNIRNIWQLGISEYSQTVPKSTPSRHA